MAIDLFSKTNANKNIKDIKQPNLTIRRHRFRGVRESEKINLEMDQLRYDLLNYSTQIDRLTQEVADLYNDMINGEYNFAGNSQAFSQLETMIRYLAIVGFKNLDTFGLTPTDTIWDGGFVIDDWGIEIDGGNP